MTAFTRFDPFERRITDAIDEIAAARPPDYLTDILRQTARTSQRPRWTFLERWISMDTAIPLPGLARRVPLRSALVVALLVAALVAAAAFIVGSQRKLPTPFGLAANGQIAYSTNGDIYVRDSLTGTGRLLIGGDLSQVAPAFSPDGTRISYVTDIPGSDPFFLANADGSNPVQIALIQPAGNAQAIWAPDSRRMALIYEINGVPTLSIASVDGSTQAIDLGGLTPWDIAWVPPDGERLLVRAADSAGRVELYTVQPDGSELKPLGLQRVSDFGPQYTLSGPAITPDGKTIVFNNVEVGHGPLNEAITHFRLHIASIDGTSERTLPGPEDAYYHETWPTISPDGKWIVAHRWAFADQVPGAQGWLVIMPADGSGAARDIGPKFDGGEGTGLIKIWSPDSSRVIVLVQNTGKVFSIDPISGESEQLPWAEDIPDWQRVAR